MGAAAPEIAARPNRLLYPQKRTNAKSESQPKWVRVSWGEALHEIATKLREVRKESGPEAVCFGRPTPSANGSSDWFPYLQRLANRFGTPNVTTTGHLCQWTRDRGSAFTYGVGLPTPHFGEAGLILMWGHNPAATNPQMFKRMRKGQRRGAMIVVIDPKYTETVEVADVWLSPRYGTDGALALGAIRALIAGGGFDEPFVTKWTNGPFLVDPNTRRFVRPQGGNAGSLYSVLDPTGCLTVLDVSESPENWSFVPQLLGSHGAAKTVFTLLWERVQGFSVSRVSQETGIPQDRIDRFYHLLATRRPICYYTWNGMEQHVNAMYTNRAICTLYSLTGCFDAPGGNVLFPSPEGIDVVGKAFLSEQQKTKRLGLETRPLGTPNDASAAPFVYRAILEGKPYPLPALLTFGSNMLLQNPNSDQGRDALRNLEFHVHVDAFETPMAQFADLLLPAATQWESPGLRMGFEGEAETCRHVQYRPAAAQPPGEARPDIEIIFELACLLGYENDFWGGDIERAFDERVRPAGLTLKQLMESPCGISTADPVRYRKYADIDQSGQVVGFSTPTRKLELYSEKMAAHGHDPLPMYCVPSTNPTLNHALAKEFPLVLTSRRLKFIVHSQHRGVPSLRKRWPDPFVEIHPETAKYYRVEDQEWVRLETDQAEITTKVVVSEKVQQGVLVGQAGWWEACPDLQLPGYDPFGSEGANLNRLISTEITDEISGSVPLKSYYCRLKKLSDHPAGSE